MDEIRQNLTDKQLKTIPIIIEAKSITEGVKKAGISKASFYEWLKNPNFQNEFEKQRKEVINLALHNLKSLTGDAVAVLRDLLKAENESVRLRTSLGILEHIAKFIELEDIEKRIEHLEEKANELKK